MEDRIERGLRYYHLAVFSVIVALWTAVGIVKAQGQQVQETAPITAEQ